MGGDFRQEPKYAMGFLGADLAWDTGTGAWKVRQIIRGDAWDEKYGSPLSRPGANVREGDSILGVNGRKASAQVSPRELLVHQSGMEVMLRVGDEKGGAERSVMIRAAKEEMPMRYRQWVERKRAWVHEKTEGRCGYVHIPDMGPRGYSEFHRYFLAEVDRDGLVIDARFNGGGHVSALILEKLARRRLAYVHSRWFGVQPWPDDAPPAPMVALTNEYAGSDGDIFSQNFKVMKLGPLIGKRTWGGVVGIWPRQALLDGGLTTQPEFAFWFKDIGWKVENYGVDPDIEVEYRPEDYASGTDPQLQRGVDELLKILKGTATTEFDPRPSRAWRKSPAPHSSSSSST
jgi:tricorn protease